MPHGKYYIYSSERLEYEEIYKNKWQKYIKNYPLFFLGLLIGFALLLSLSFLFYTSNEKRLLNEQKTLKKEFEVLNQKVSKTENLVNILNTKDDSLYRVILGIDPLPQSVKKAGQGGSGKKNYNLNINDKELVDSISTKVNNINSKAIVLDYSFDKILDEARKNKIKMLHIPVIMPIYNKNLKRTGAGFGMRKHPILNITRMHEGIDFYANTGTEVYATANGVTKSARYSTTFGNVIVIDHGYDLETLYAHLSKFNVSKGQKIKRGQVIGYVGSTGLSSGPHLHYEVHFREKEINPVHYFYGDLKPKEYEKIIELSDKQIYSMD